MIKVGIINNGCARENALIQNFASELKVNGMDRSSSLLESDYFLYISCAGTGDIINFEKNDIKNIVEFYCNDNNKKVILVGCLTKFKEAIKDLKENNNIIPISTNDWINPVINYIISSKKKNTIEDILKNRTLNICSSSKAVQLFIQKGCPNHCSFCKTHYLDLKLESLDYDILLNYIKELIKSGVKEITISGENTTVYGIDLYNRPILHLLLHEMSKEEGLERIRLHEITAQNMYPELLEEIRTNKKISMVSMQLESASNETLKLMNRGITLEDYDAIAKVILESGKYLSTILMSGFPYETYADLDQTIEYIVKRKILVEQVCEYDNFALIPSSKYEQLAEEEKKQHTNYLKKAVLKNNQNIYIDYYCNLNKYIYLGEYDGKKYFDGDIEVFSIDNPEEYNNLTLGDIVNKRAEKILLPNKKISL